MARQTYVANDRADTEAALERQMQWNRRTIAAAQSPDGKGGSHILSYAATPDGTQAHSLFGTPDEVCAKLEALRAAGVDYVIMTLLGGMPQVRRFARDIMPAFAAA